CRLRRPPPALQAPSGILILVILFLFGPRGLVAPERCELRGVEGNADVRSAAGAVEEGDLAHMFLDDLLDDRQAKSRAADPGRHIGLGQPLAVLGRPTPVSSTSMTSSPFCSCTFRST